MKRPILVYSNDSLHGVVYKQNNMGLNELNKMTTLSLLFPFLSLPFPLLFPFLFLPFSFPLFKMAPHT
jgi:hypothetical protein